MHSNMREHLWTMRHIDDFVIVGRTMLLRDVQFLEPGKPPVKFLVWVLERTVDGSRLGINPQLTEDIVRIRWRQARGRSVPPRE